MKLSEYKKISDTYTSKASDIIRQLILGGIAIIWIFKFSDSGRQTLDRFLLVPLITLCFGLIADLLQYVIGGKIWNNFFIKEERKAKSNQRIDPTLLNDPDIKAPRILNKPIYLFYWLKIGFMLISYILIIIYLVRKINFS